MGCRADISGGRPQRLGDIGAGLRRPKAERRPHDGPHTTVIDFEQLYLQTGSGNAANKRATVIVVNY